MSRLSFLPLERNPVLKTGIFLRLSFAAIVLSLFFFSSCASTSYFEDKNVPAGSDTERTSSSDDTSEDAAKKSDEPGEGSR